MLDFKKFQDQVDGDWYFCEAAPVISGVSEIIDAKSSDLVYAVDARRVNQVESSDCGFAIVPRGNWEVTCPHVRVDNPYYVFALALELLDPFERERVGVSVSAVIHPEAFIGADVQVHPGAIVERGAVVGDRTVLMSNAVVGEQSRIGEDCLIYQNVVVRERCVLGDRVIIQPGCVIGSDGYGFVHEGGVHHKIPQIGSVVISDDVELGANVTVDRGTFRPTVIGKGSKIDNLVQIGHNVVMGEGCLMASQSGLSGTTTVEDYVTFGGQSGSVGHITVGKGSIIFARGVPTQSVPPGSKISGFPGREHKEDLKTIASVRKIPKLSKQIRRILKVLNLDSDV